MEVGGAPMLGSDDGGFGLFNKPKIRHITGIRIHQLTLPNALPFASKLVSDRATHEAPIEGYGLGEPSASSSPVQSSLPPISASPDAITLGSSPSLRRVPSQSGPSRRDRRISDAGTIKRDSGRERSSSNSAVGPPSSPTIQARMRGGRPRAPTLAGEAMEGQGHVSTGVHLHGSMDEQRALEEVKKRRLTRCFVVLKLPAPPLPESGTAPVAHVHVHVHAEDSAGSTTSVPGPRRKDSGGQDKLAVTGKPKQPRLVPLDTARRPLSRTSSSQSTPSPPGTPRLRPTLSSSSSRSSLSGTAPTSPSATARTRTASLTSPSPSTAKRNVAGASVNANADGHVVTNGNATIPRAASQASQSRRPALARAASDVRTKQPGPSSPLGSFRESTPITEKLSSRPSLHANRSDRAEPETIPERQAKASDPITPFYISSIHHPSTHPRWISLSHDTDFAPWLTVEEAASSAFTLEVWYEDCAAGWRILGDVGGKMHLGGLRRVEREDEVGENTLLFSFSTDPRGMYYLPPSGEVGDQAEDDGSEVRKEGKKKRESVKGIVERSLRETRMKQGVGIGGLHQLVNMQAVIADTQRGIDAVRRKIDDLLSRDADARALRRDVKEGETRVAWIRDKIAEVERTKREVEAGITLRRRAIERRSDHLCQAEESDDLARGVVQELMADITSVETERIALLPVIHHFRAHHVQTLDFLFPITPISPANLLYSVLDVPLPIPSGAKDPAPPLSLPPNVFLPDGTTKVDERTTAAALGYVAMVVQLLGTLGGATGGLPYPITCAGSRSLVKDVVSVMQGPRAFPLYTKGVERYRYEYAVFLLNKDIEMLMQEANIRLVDIRHTLPNLKALLLTLSSPVAPAPGHPIPGPSSTYISSLPSSRNTSRAWSFSRGLASPSSSSATGPVSPATASPGGVGAVRANHANHANLANQAVHASASPLAREGGRRGRGSMLSRTSTSTREDDDDDDEDDRDDDDDETADEKEG